MYKILSITLLEFELLEQYIIELEAKNYELEAKNTKLIAKFKRIEKLEKVEQKLHLLRDTETN